MTHYIYYAVCLGFLATALPSRAADRPHVETNSQKPLVWTNDDLEKLHSLGLISVVGRIDEERPTLAPTPETYRRNQDPEWYASQATNLRNELERRQTQLREYRQALEDARSLKKTTDHLNLDEGEIAVNPETGIEILEGRVNEVQTEFDALEDLARRHEIPPGTLRGQ